MTRRWDSEVEAVRFDRTGTGAVGRNINGTAHDAVQSSSGEADQRRSWTRLLHRQLIPSDQQQQRRAGARATTHSYKIHCDISDSDGLLRT